MDYFPIGGINQEDPEISLKETEVRGAENFLFERQMAITRPGTTAHALALGQRIQFGRSFDFGSSVKTVVLGTSKLWSLSSSFAPTEITGAGLTWGAPETLSAESVNGLLVMGGNSGGIVRWDPTGGTYTVMAAAPYRYVTAHINRIIACYKLGGGDALLDPRTVAWSTAGDETDWTSFGAGSAVLADSPGEMTGIANVRDVIVIAKTDGFHLGTPTGVSTPAFYWRLHSKNARWGCKYASTFCASQDAVFYVGRSDVFTFQLVGNPQAIGRPIRRELLGYLNAGYLYRGFVSESYGANARPHYHLVPMSSGITLPHFAFDIEENTWSRHLYPFTPYGGWYQLLTGTTSAPLLVTDDASGNVNVWDDTQACESESRLRGRRIVLGQLAQNSNIDRVLVQYATLGGSAVGPVLLEVQASHGGDPVAQTANEQMFTAADVGRWERQWFDVRVTGQIPRVDITVPSGSACAINYIGTNETPAGAFRQVAG